MVPSMAQGSTSPNRLPAKVIYMLGYSKSYLSIQDKPTFCLHSTVKSRANCLFFKWCQPIMKIVDSKSCFLWHFVVANVLQEMFFQVSKQAVKWNCIVKCVSNMAIQTMNFSSPNRSSLHGVRQLHMKIQPSLKISFPVNLERYLF